MLKMFFIKDTLIVDHIFLNTVKDLKKKKKKWTKSLTAVMQQCLM